MALDLSLSQTQQMQHKLTPQQRQSLEMLVATSLELNQLLNQKAEQNPAIEVTSHIEIPSGNPTEEALGGEDAESSPEIPNESNDAYAGNETSQWSQDQEEKRQFAFNSLTESKSLQEQLLEQLNDLVPDKETDLYKGCLEVLGNLDGQGYLTASDEEIASGCNLPLEVVGKAVEVVQRMSPAGIGGRDLREVLLLQLKRKREVGSIAWDIVDNYLEDLGRNRIPQIAKALDVEVSEVQEALEHIRELDPKPGSSEVSQAAMTFLPEAEIYKNAEGHWCVKMQEDAFPEVVISSEYLNLLNDRRLSKEDKSVIMKYVDDGKQLIKSLDFRKSTIQKITESILHKQLSFFEKGPSALRPLCQAELAELLELSESTISRAIENKFVITPFGTKPYKYFFPSGVSTVMGEDVSSQTIKLKIQKMIDAEDAAKPISDQFIADELAKDGLKVARRTVAKYREAIGIPATSLRKLHK